MTTTRAFPSSPQPSKVARSLPYNETVDTYSYALILWEVARRYGASPRDRPPFSPERASVALSSFPRDAVEEVCLCIIRVETADTHHQRNPAKKEWYHLLYFRRSFLLLFSTRI